MHGQRERRVTKYNDLHTVEMRLLYFTIDSIRVKVIGDKHNITAIPRIGSLYSIKLLDICHLSKVVPIAGLRIRTTYD